VPKIGRVAIWLCGWNGRDICIALKSAEQTKYVPILLFSASKDTGKIVQEAGADDFIAKPFDMEELLEKVEKYLA
jgi:DNA-binding response OmpR family regulator